MTEDEEKKQSVYLFYKYLMPCVCGKKYWKSRYKKERISQMCTVSQEALALWILHNYEKKQTEGDGNKNVQALYTGITKGNKMFQVGMMKLFRSTTNSVPLSSRIGKKELTLNMKFK